MGVLALVQIHANVRQVGKIPIVIRVCDAVGQLLLELCSLPLAYCLPGCQNGGRCVGPNSCECPSGYKGDRCQDKSKPRKIVPQYEPQTYEAVKSVQIPSNLIFVICTTNYDLRCLIAYSNESKTSLALSQYRSISNFLS